MNININLKTIDELILEIDNGSDAALEELYNLTRLDVFKLAFSYLKNSNDAEDVMQDTYINIKKYVYQYNSRSKAIAWILTITKNLCLNKIKSNKNKLAVDVSDYENELKVSEKGYNSVLIKTILDEFTEEERKIFILSTVENFKFKEIAQLLDLKLSTVLSKYNRAIKRVQNKYKEGNMA